MKKMILCLLAVSMQLCAVEKVFWKLGSIINNSDLQLESAWRTKKGAKNQITALTSTLRQRAASKTPLFLHYTIGQSLGTFSLQATANSNIYELFFDCHATHAIGWKRKKTKTIIKLPEIAGCAIADGNYCARAYVLAQPASTVVCQTNQAFNHESEALVLNLTISGSQGLYELTLAAA